MCLMVCPKYFGRKSVRRREGKHGSSLESCNGKLQNISYKMRLQSRDGNWGCSLWRRGRE